MISTQQIAGEAAALDLMLAHLTHDTEAIATATADSTVRPTTAACSRQQPAGLLHDAVLAHPDISLHRPAVLGPAGRNWLQHAAINGPVADTAMALALALALALANDGAAPRHPLDDAQSITTYAISAVARLIDVYGQVETRRTPHPDPGHGLPPPGQPVDPGTRLTAASRG
ncbi:hypothetical protein AB0C90_35380 [Streptomyces sp. NPDC048550]|uniref:hypothetical protein n=1 Tax=Streptomyces sp. NPDC048550 TaxID=3155739 RepID=UPI003417D1BB